jgi:hypothetical protein
MMRKQYFLSGGLAVMMAGALLPPAQAAESGDAWVNRIDKRVSRMRPNADETRFDLIGWAPGLRDAIAAAKSSHRPVFFFTNSGYINRGRC